MTEDKRKQVIENRLRGGWELFKHVIVHFWYHFSVAFAGTAILLMFEPVAGFITVPVKGYLTIFSFSVYMGVMGGVIGALDAIAKEDDSLKLLLIPSLYKKAKDSVSGEKFYRLSGKYVVRSGFSFGDYLPKPAVFFSLVTVSIKRRLYDL